MVKINRKRVIDELNQTISWFSEKRFMKTVEWLSFIKSNVENRNPTQYIDDIKDVFNGYNSDTKKCNKHYQQCAYVIQNIFYNLFKQGGNTFSATLEDSYPLLEKWLVTQSNFKNMLELTRNTEISERARYYLYCFGYLITVEGDYSNIIKILYRMICQSINIPDDISTIIDWKPHKIEKKLIEINSEFSILFTGYFNGNLRNAVGHGDFFYDESSKKMHFNHIWKGQEKFKIELSFNEFYQIFSEVFACRDIFMETVFLVRLFDYRTLLTKIDQRK